ncbi:MAG: flagellar FlbD family protein [bacterium]|jgi:flagellar protein FlbD
MIELTKINGEAFVLNCDLIESIEAAPDTILKLTNGKKVIVRETVKEVVMRVVEFRRRIHILEVGAPDAGAGGPALREGSG